MLIRCWDLAHPHVGQFFLPAPFGSRFEPLLKKELKTFHLPRSQLPAAVPTHTAALAYSAVKKRMPLINELHEAVRHGRTPDRVARVVWRAGQGVLDQGDLQGRTYLTPAAIRVSSPIAKLLLSKGASVSAIADKG